MNRPHLFCLAAAGLLLATTWAARGQTWGGNSSDWNTAANWSPATVPNSTTAIANLGNLGTSAVNISSSVTVQSLNFSSQSYNLTSSAIQTLTIAVGSINVGAGAFAGINLGSLQFTGSNLTLNNNTSGLLAIGANIGTSGTGGVIVNGPGETILEASFAPAGPDSVVGGLTKNGPGILDYAGSGAGLTGGITLNGGILQMDYSSNTTSKLGGGALTLGGGQLLIYPFSTPSTQTIPGGTFVIAGHTDVQAPGPGILTLALGAFTRQVVGGTVDFTPVVARGVNFSVTTTTGITNGLLGGGPAFATVSGGSTWATESSGAITGYSAYSTNTYGSALNTDVTAAASIGGFTTNSLRFNSGSLTMTLFSTNTLQSGGILVTPSAGASTITGGTLTAFGAGELFVHQYSGATFTINSAVVSTTSLTKTGPGVLSLGGTNTGLTGAINVNRGGLTVTVPAAVNSASAINFNDDRTNISGSALQQFTVDLGTGVSGMISRPISVSAFAAIQSDTDYGTYFTTGSSSNSRVQVSGVISSGLGLTTPILFTGGSDNSSGFNLTTANSFAGNINLLHGFLGITADTSLGNAANVLSLDVNNTTNGGLAFLNTGVNVAHAVTVTSPTRIVSNGTDSNTISGPISGTAGIYKDGTGMLTITNAGNTFTGLVTVAAGTLTLGVPGSLPAGTNVTINTGATFTPGTTSLPTGDAIGTLTLNGGTFRVSSGAGQFVVNQIVTTAAGGGLNFTGAGAALFFLETAGTAITVNGNSTWLSPGNGAQISAVNSTAAISIAPGVTLTNGIALGNLAGFGFTVTGGGTLFQNSDTTNELGMTAAVTVSQGVFRVTDATSNGGVGNFGAGTFTLDGGTFSYGGVTAATSKPIALTSNGGAIGVESAATVLTANGAITGPGGLTKVGLGTLLLANSSNSFPSLTVTAGTIQTSNDNTLGGGTVTVAAAGTLLYTGIVTTARTFNLNFGTLQASAGSVVNLNGAAVNGGFLRGPGTFSFSNGVALSGVTTQSSAVINQTGSASFVNVTNGGSLTVAAAFANPAAFIGFTNQGSGAITVGANSQVNASDFETYGLLTLNNGTATTRTLLTNVGTTPMYFNGGSQTFIGTIGGNGQAQLELNGNNAIVAGGLLVNNGHVTDNSPAGVSTIIAEYGALVKGAGVYDNSPQTVNGGKFQSGNSPGVATMGRFVFGPSGVSNYIFAIDDATGQAGPTPDALGHVSGWGLVKAAQWQRTAGPTSGDFVWTADAANPLTVAIDTLVNPTTVGIDVSGLMADFDPTRSYSWPAVEWTGTYSGPTDVAALNAATNFDTSGFVNPIAGSFGWSLDPAGQALSLIYTPSAVPEPGTLALVSLVAVCAAAQRGSRRRSGASGQ